MCEEGRRSWSAEDENEQQRLCFGEAIEAKLAIAGDLETRRFAFAPKEASPGKMMTTGVIKVRARSRHAALNYLLLDGGRDDKASIRYL